MNYACPKCKTALIWDSNNPFRPFCSERCKNIDFVAWANEENAIPAEHNFDEDSDIFN